MHRVNLNSSDQNFRLRSTFKRSILLFYPSNFMFTLMRAQLSLWAMFKHSNLFFFNHLSKSFSVESFYFTVFEKSPLLLDNATTNKVRAKQD